MALDCLARRLTYIASSSGNGNTFGNDNSILSGNDGISIGKKVRRSASAQSQTLGSYVGNVVDSITVPLNPGSSNTIWASPSNNGNNNGGGNTAGSGNLNNGNGSKSLLPPCTYIILTNNL